MAIADSEATDASEEASQAPPLRIIAADELGQLRGTPYSFLSVVFSRSMRIKGHNDSRLL